MKNPVEKWILPIFSKESKRNSAPFWKTLPGVDTRKGIAMSGGTVEKFKQTLAVFRQDGIEKIEQIKKCLEANDIHMYVIHVHALKSAAANIGANDLSEIANTLEIAGEEQEQALIRTLTPKLLSVLKTLLDAIDITLVSDGKGKQKTTADITLLKTELAKLAEAIDSVNPRAIREAVNNVKPFTQATDVGNVVERILRNVSIGEYEEAAAMIRTLEE